MSNNNFSLDEDAQEDLKIIEFARNYLPSELKEKFTDDQFFYFLDLLGEFFEESGLMDDTSADEVEIPVEELVNFIVKEAKRDEIGEFDPDEIILVVQGILDYDN